MTIKTGGPAFPQMEPNSCHYNAEGMTLLDWFAGQAPPVQDWWMSGDVPTQPPCWNDGDGPEKWDDAVISWQIRRIALWRVAYADAMIAAREVE